MTWFFLRAFQPAVQEPGAPRRENLFQMMKFLRDGFDSGGRIFFLQAGIDDVSLASFGELFANKLPHLGQAGRRRAQTS